MDPREFEKTESVKRSLDPVLDLFAGNGISEAISAFRTSGPTFLKDIQLEGGDKAPERDDYLFFVLEVPAAGITDGTERPNAVPVFQERLPESIEQILPAIYRGTYLDARLPEAPGWSPLKECNGLVVQFINSYANPEDPKSQSDRKQALAGLLSNGMAYDNPTALTAYRDLQAVDACHQLFTASNKWSTANNDTEKAARLTEIKQALAALVALDTLNPSSTPSKLLELYMREQTDQGAWKKRVEEAKRSVDTKLFDVHELVETIVASAHSKERIESNLANLTLRPDGTRDRETIKSTMMVNFLHRLSSDKEITSAELAEGLRLLVNSASQSSGKDGQLARDLFKTLDTEGGAVLVDQIKSAVDQNREIPEDIAKHLRADLQKVIGDEIPKSVFMNVPGPLLEALRQNPDLWKESKKISEEKKTKLSDERELLVSELLQRDNTLSASDMRSKARQIAYIDFQTGGQSQGVSAQTFRTLANWNTLTKTDSPQEAAASLADLRVASGPANGALLNALTRAGVTEEDLLSEDQQATLARLKECLATAEVKNLFEQQLNQARISQIVEPFEAKIRRGYIVRPSSDTLQLACDRLAKEAAAGNPLAPEQLGKMRVEHELARLRAATDPTQAKKIVDDLIACASRKDDSSSRASISALIAIATSDRQLYANHHLPFEAGLGKLITCPIIFSTDKANQTTLRAQAADGLSALLKSRDGGEPIALTEKEAMNLATAFSLPGRPDETRQKSTTAPADGAALPEDTRRIATIEAILLDQLERGNEDAVQGVIDAFSHHVPGLSKLLVAGCHSETFVKNCEALAKHGISGDTDMIKMLSELALTKGYSNWASRALVMAAADQKQTEKVVNQALESFRNHKHEDRDGSFLEALGAISMLLPDSSNSRHELSNAMLLGFVKAQELSLGLESDGQPESKELAKQLRLGAARGLLTDQRNLTNEAIRTICGTLSDESLVALPSAAAVLTEGRINEFRKCLRSELENTSEQNGLVLAVNALSLFSPNATKEDVRAIDAKYSQLSKAAPDSAETKKPATPLEQATARAMLRIVFNSSNREARNGALDVLEKKSWPADLDRDVKMLANAMLLDSGSRGTDELARLSELFPGLNVHPPLHMVLKNLGVQGDDQKLQDLATRLSGGTVPLEEVISMVMLSRTHELMDKETRTLLGLEPMFSPTEVAEMLASGDMTNLKKLDFCRHDLPQALAAKKIALEQERIEIANKMFERQKAVLTDGPTLFADRMSALDKEIRNLESKAKGADGHRSTELGGVRASQRDRLESLAEQKSKERDAESMKICEGMVESHRKWRQGDETLTNKFHQNSKNLQSLDKCTTTLSYLSRKATGQNEQAAQILLKSWEAGSLPRALEPELARLWNAMQRVNTASLPDIPVFLGGEASFNKALRTRAEAKSIEYGHARYGDPQLRQLSRDARDAVVGRSEREIMEHPAIKKLLERQQEYMKITSPLPGYFHVLMSSKERNENLIETVTGMCHEVKQFLDSKETREAVTDIKALLEDKSLPPEMRAMLKRAVDDIDPDKRHLQDKLEKIINAVNNGEIKNPDQWEQFRNAMIETAVVLATVAVAAAVCTATCGAAAPAVIFLLMPVVATAGGHAGQELLHQMKLAPRGSAVVDHLFAREHYDHQTASFRVISGHELRDQLSDQLKMQYVLHGLTLGAGTLGKTVAKPFVSLTGKTIVANGEVQAIRTQLSTQLAVGNSHNKFLRALADHAKSSPAQFGIAAAPYVHPDLESAHATLFTLYAFAHGAYGKLRSPIGFETNNIPEFTKAIRELGFKPDVISKDNTLTLGVRVGDTVLPVRMGDAYRARTDFKSVVELGRPVQNVKPITEPTHKGTTKVETKPTAEAAPLVIANPEFARNTGSARSRPIEVNRNLSLSEQIRTLKSSQSAVKDPDVQSEIARLAAHRLSEIMRRNEDCLPERQTLMEDIRSYHGLAQPQFQSLLDNLIGPAIAQGRTEQIESALFQSKAYSDAIRCGALSLQDFGTVMSLPAGIRQAIVDPHFNPDIRPCKDMYANAVRAAKIYSDLGISQPNLKSLSELGPFMRTYVDRIVLDEKTAPTVSRIEQAIIEAQRLKPDPKSLDMLVRTFREVAKGLSDNEADPQSRENSLNNLLEAMSRHKDAQFPAVRFKIVPDAQFNSSGAAAYDWGSGVIMLRQSDFIGKSNSQQLKALSDSINHEVVHHQQMSLIVRYLAQTGTDTHSALESHLGFKIDRNFVGSVLEHRSSRSPLTAAERANAEILIKSAHRWQTTVSKELTVAQAATRPPNVPTMHDKQRLTRALFDYRSAAHEAQAFHMDFVIRGNQEPAKPIWEPRGIPESKIETTAKGLTKITVNDVEVELRKMPGGWWWPIREHGTIGNTKLHITTSDPKDCMKVQAVFIEALAKDPELAERVTYWKTLSPIGENATGKDQGAKAFTIYTKNAEDAIFVQKRLDEIAMKTGLALEKPVSSNNVDLTGPSLTRPDLKSNRIGVVRDHFEPVAPGNPHPNMSAKIDPVLSEYIHKALRLNGNERLSSPQLRHVETLAGIKRGTLGYSDKGELVMESYGSRQRTSPEDPTMFYLTEVEAIKLPGSKTDRPAYFALAETFLPDGYDVIDIVSGKVPKDLAPRAIPAFREQPAERVIDLDIPTTLIESKDPVLRVEVAANSSLVHIGRSIQPGLNRFEVVSQNHGSIIRNSDGSIHFVDRSQNGTYVKRAGEKEFVKYSLDKFRINPGDEIRLGANTGPRLEVLATK